MAEIHDTAKRSIVHTCVDVIVNQRAERVAIGLDRIGLEKDRFQRTNDRIEYCEVSYGG